MNPPETQSETEGSSQYFDPEQPDNSEQQFAVTLEQDPEAAPFFVEQERGVLPPTTSLASSGAAFGASSDGLDDSKLDGAPIEEQLAPEKADGGDWRNLVSERVNSYKSRRPRPQRYPSLHLQPENDQHGQKTFARQLQLEVSNSDPDTAALPHVERAHAHLPVALENTARVLEFPRPAEPPVWSDELAEPVLDRPRIVEAPELLPPPPAMGGILIEQQIQAEPERRPGFDVPLQSASLRRRVAAGTIDAIAVAIAAGLFTVVVLKIVGGPLPVRAEFAIVGGLIALCWPAYQYSFLVFCGNTPGLRLTGLQLRKFDGSLPIRSLRRWRVLASVLSAASLGLGYLWCFLDEDELSWHDRITRTHLANSQL